MKKTLLPAALVCAAMLCSSCGTTQSAGLLSSIAQNAGAAQPDAAQKPQTPNTENPQTSGSILGNLLSGILGGSEKLTAENIVGTWNYDAPDCVFESENLLMKAGGEVAAKKVEAQLTQQLAKIGVKQGSCTFTFNEDGTYTAAIGKRKLTGKYEINAEKKTVKMSYLSGLGSMEPKVAVKGGKLSLLYESDKLLKLVSSISALSGSSAGSTLGELLGKYDGLYVGVKLAK